MAHTHKADHTAFYAEQICTIVISGALGAVASALYFQGTLQYMLANKFHIWVLAGGAALLALALVRAVSFARSLARGRADAHACVHEHGDVHPAEAHHHHHEGECCEHDHAEDGHGHGEVAHAGCSHGHDHGWSPWRYLLLLVPVVLYLLNLPNQGFSNLKDMDVSGLDTATRQVATKGERTFEDLDPNELSRAANRPDMRDFYEGHMGSIVGQLVPQGDSGQLFTLVRYKITCCSADAVPINILIVTEKPLTKRPGDWVKVLGQIQFRKRKDEFVPVLQVSDNKNIEKSPPAGFLQS